MSTKIAIMGAAGRMGKMLIHCIDQDPSLVLSVAIEHQQSPHIGMDAGLVAGLEFLNVPITHRLSDISQEWDLLIDFTRPDVTVANAELCAVSGKAMIIGSTGMNTDQLNVIKQAATKTAICMASNYSVGVTLCLKLLRQAAQVLAEEAVDIEIIEAHHRHKIDSPSGTALSMGEAIADTLGRDLSTCAVYGREGIGEERDYQTIGFSTIRGGDIVGDHTALFAMAGERVEITHKASSRDAFARGAVRAGKWLINKPAGLYSMEDVLA